MAVLGVGLAALGRPGYITLQHGGDFPEGRAVEAMRQRTHAVLDEAWALGVRHFDAARSYGLAEQFLGDWLRLHPGRRAELTVGSKWGYTYVADWRVDVDVHETKDHSVETFERQWPETLEALGGPPDLYLVHSLTPDSPALDNPALLRALHDVADRGVRVGLSTSGPQQADVLERAVAMGGPFSAVQSTWNLLETSAGDALRRALDAGWHVALKETVANGRLTERGTPPGVVREVAGRHRTTVDAVAVAAALTAPATVVLLGPTTVEQLRGNVAALRVGLDDAERAALLGCAEEPDTYWRARGALPWT
jgi:aryl-alcohol dehydrogenase-like predicted oxidoreductase